MSCKRRITWKIYILLYILCFYVSRLYYAMVHFCQLHLGYSRPEGYLDPWRILLAFMPIFIWVSHNLTRLFTKFSLVLLYKSTPSMCFFFYSPLPDDAILCSVKNPLVKQQGFLPTAMTRQRFPGKMLYLLPAFLLDGKLAACPLLIEMQALRLRVFALHSSRSSLFSSPETWLWVGDSGFGSYEPDLSSKFSYF